MDAESIQQIITAMLEEQQKKADERENRIIQEAQKREERFLNEINLLKLEKGSREEAPNENNKADVNIIDQKSIMSLIAEIEPFEPTDVAEDDEEDGKFEEWLKRFQLAFECSAPNTDDKTKVKFLMTKLSKKAFSEYNKYCLPRDVTEFTFDETTQRLRELFDMPQYSLFADRYECLRITKDDSENFQNYFQRVKKALRKFNFNELKEEQFYCLVALAGIRSPDDEAARTCLLQRLNADGEKVRFEQVVGDCLNFLKVRKAADSSYQRSTLDNGRRGRRRGGAESKW